jgi:hypothetical protein
MHSSVVFLYRESLLGQLIVHQKSLQQNFTDASGGKAPKGKNLPEFVNTIVYVRQIEAKVSCLCCKNDKIMRQVNRLCILCVGIVCFTFNLDCTFFSLTTK